MLGLLGFSAAVQAGTAVRDAAHVSRGKSVIGGAAAGLSESNLQTFDTVGAHDWVVPSGIDTVRIKAQGAGGGGCGLKRGCAGGHGGDTTVAGRSFKLVAHGGAGGNVSHPDAGKVTGSKFSMKGFKTAGEGGHNIGFLAGGNPTGYGSGGTATGLHQGGWAGHMSSYTGYPGGSGGYGEGLYQVSPGETLTVIVGGGGASVGSAKPGVAGAVILEF